MKPSAKADVRARAFKKERKKKGEGKEKETLKYTACARTAANFSV